MRSAMLMTSPPRPSHPAQPGVPPTRRHRSAGPTPPPPPPPTAAPTARQRTPRETQHARHGAGLRSRRTTATGEPKRDADETNDGGSSGHRQPGRLSDLLERRTRSERLTAPLPEHLQVIRRPVRNRSDQVEAGVRLHLIQSSTQPEPLPERNDGAHRATARANTMTSPSIVRRTVSMSANRPSAATGVCDVLYRSER